MTAFSALKRTQYIQKLIGETFDLVVIGGGITGAGIALDAAARGMKVALIEKNDFAAGTSSRSTKLIHGGLRYLKQFEFGLVREVGSERAIVHRLAPHLVLPEKMLLPLVEGGTYSSFATSIGLAVYDILANVRGDDRRRMVSIRETLDLEPLLKPDGVTGGGYYAEYRTDDARLTIEIVKKAVEYGATCLNYVKASDFQYKDGRATDVNCKDVRTGNSFSIATKYIVNAAGPWVDELRSVNNSLKGKTLFPTKGVHIVVPHERLPIRQSVYFDTPDGRMVFAIPRQRVTYIGTTDTPYSGNLNEVFAAKEDVEYLLKATNHIFPTVALAEKDVVSTWAGIRPLIFEEGKSASELSRKDEIFISETGLISIAGGKLTGYRKMAERIVNLVAKKAKSDYKMKFDNCKTAYIPLGSANFESKESIEEYKRDNYTRFEKLGLSAFWVNYLVDNYGRQTDAILKIMPNFEGNLPENALLYAELQFSIQNEMTTTPRDFFIRRTGRLYFLIETIEKSLPIIFNDFKSYFNWDEATFQDEIARFQHEFEGVTAFKATAV
jgi:glycerol-3-phosphate dehydrogenase